MRLALFTTALLLAPACLDTNEGQVGDVSSPQNAGDTAADSTATDTARDTTAPDTDAADTDAADTTAPDTTTPDTTATDTTPQCLALEAECWDHASCCSGACSWMGAYVAGNCIAKRQVGEPCGDDTFCSTGFCDQTQGLCVAAQCLAVGADCSVNSTWCCPGTFCQWSQTYAPSLCSAPLPTGATCFEATWCKSGECTAEGRCK